MVKERVDSMLRAEGLLEEDEEGDPMDVSGEAAEAHGASSSSAAVTTRAQRHAQALAQAFVTTRREVMGDEIISALAELKERLVAAGSAPKYLRLMICFDN